MSNYSFINYSKDASITACYPEDTAIEYCILGMVGEAGEIANKYKKILRGDKVLDDKNREALKYEIGDVLWYLSQLSTELGYTLEEVAKMNIEKLHSRYKRNQIKGDGDDR